MIDSHKFIARSGFLDATVHVYDSKESKIRVRSISMILYSRKMSRILSCTKHRLFPVPEQIQYPEAVYLNRFKHEHGVVKIHGTFSFAQRNSRLVLRTLLDARSKNDTRCKHDRETRNHFATRFLFRSRSFANYVVSERRVLSLKLNVVSLIRLSELFHFFRLGRKREGKKKKKTWSSSM